MSDEIRDFVDRNREEFDHLEAPAFDMARFKRTLPKKEVVIKKLPFYKSPKWLAAACLLIVVATSWFIYQQNKETEVVYTKTKPVESKTTNKLPEVTNNKIEPTEKPTEKVAFVSLDKAIPKKSSIISNNNDDYKGLRDSSSASMRLLTIMEIEKSDKMNNKMLDMLAQTLNHDGNTNVRLAALSVLQKFSFDGHASGLLVKSLDKQSDPIVQLGLISQLGKMKNVNIDEKLYALANNPETFVAVRDEANKILLNQDKL
ncbi:HEAT repeat domain-containing protein [Pedobacter aquatilis]|uniref:HEAT repeat domain-containing protein n=1 Tax=Pedobacter aquatilis TaxID=351343 RepID=UPI0025B32C76|nr:HEAT repeat domain-containing protein [Pedobacter aquatilis]MDN3588287.1 HEAT repeat domain-containing protein [Pedobacter aquatilis]